MTLPEEPIKFHQYSSGKLKSIDTHVIVEKEVLLTVNGEIWLSFNGSAFSDERPMVIPGVQATMRVPPSAART